MSDTPRTDANTYDTLAGAARCSPSIAYAYVPVTLSRQLERELNRSNEMFRKLNIHSLDLTDRIRRLEELVEIGGRMADIGQKIVHQGGEDMYWIRKLEEELTEWTIAKEAKP